MLSEPKGAPEPILEGRVWDRFDALGRSSPNDPQFARRRRPDSTNCVEEPLGRRERIAVATRIRAVDFEPFALCGEDRCRKGDQLRQFPQVLGGGRQSELIFGSARPAKAQSVEPEDALQMSEQHLDFLSFAM